jgi:hypothetical protein
VGALMRAWIVRHPWIFCITVFVAAMLVIRAFVIWGVDSYGAWFGFAFGAIMIFIGFLWDRHDRQRDNVR